LKLDCFYSQSFFFLKGFIFLTLIGSHFDWKSCYSFCLYHVQRQTFWKKLLTWGWISNSFVCIAWWLLSVKCLCCVFVCLSEASFWEQCQLLTPSIWFFFAWDDWDYFHITYSHPLLCFGFTHVFAWVWLNLSSKIVLGLEVCLKTRDGV